MQNISVHSAFIKSGKLRLFLAAVIIPILFFFIPFQPAIAQDDDPGRAPAVSIPPIPPNIMEYLKGKYNKVDEDGVNARLQQTPNGPLGSIGIAGEDITPKAGRNIPQLAAMSKEDRSRAIAKAFIAEEVALLGITNIDEIREIEFEIGPTGYTHIDYRRYIGDLLLDGVEIKVHIGPNGNIRSVSADAIPISPAVYEAVAKETLKDSDIRRIIERDLAPPGKKSAVRISKIDKVAISLPPYVIYKVEAGAYAEYSWNYRVDAFTGEILEKQDARQFLR